MSAVTAPELRQSRSPSWPGVSCAGLVQVVHRLELDRRRPETASHVASRRSFSSPKRRSADEQVGGGRHGHKILTTKYLDNQDIGR